MSRLPTPGGDNGTWGDILNAYLEVSHASDGTLNSNVVGTSQIQSGAVTNAQLDSPTQTTLASVAGKYVKPGGGIPSTDMTAAVQTSLAKAGTSEQTANKDAANGYAGLDGSGLLKTAELPSSVVTASSASNGQIPAANGTGGYAWTNTLSQIAASMPYHVELSESHGAVGNDSTDDTAALAAAVQAAVTAGVANGSNYAEVWLSSKTYLLSGATTQSSTYKGNAQIPLPLIADTAAKFTLVIKGVGEAAALYHWLQTSVQHSGAVLHTTLTGTNDGTWGEASVIGGPTPAQGYGWTNSGALYTNMLIVIDGVQILSGDNPTMCGFDFRGIAECNFKDGAFLTTTVPSTYNNASDSTHAWQFGLALPQFGNNALCEIGQYSCEGCYVGVYLEEHSHAQTIRCLYCLAGIEFGSSTVSYNGYHTAVVDDACVEGSNVALGCLNNNPIKILVHNLDVEDISFAVITDPNNSLLGEVRASFLGNGKHLSAGTDIRGANNLRIYDTTLNSGFATAPSIPSSTVQMLNPFFATAAVNITGGSVTVIAIDGSPTGLTSGTVIVPTGKSITLTYSSAPSWNWTLL